MSICKPRPRRVEMSTAEDLAVHHWLARLAVSLSIIAEELPPGALRKHARKTLDEFCDSDACSDTLAAHVKDAQ